jgi:UDPglucose--hexose-1-phosphate uridylyltransferase
MPQLRQNIATKEWVIIATERARRPDDYQKHDVKERESPPYSTTCPFCPGNEHMTPPATYAVMGANNEWQVRVTPNKYAALIHDDEPLAHHVDGIKHWMEGFGIHEVVIETPQHNMGTALLPVEHITEIIRTYRERYIDALKDPRIELVTIFKNHGEQAGTSLDHPHSQLIATPVVPLRIRHRVTEAMNYYDEHGTCVFCEMLQQELRMQERIICENEHFAAFIIYAAPTPFHTWIMPKKHCASFGTITDEQIAGLAAILKTVLLKLRIGLKDPDYNYVVRSLPGMVRKNEFYHWYLSLIPRIVKAAGFELGSGMYINAAVPEDSAAFLRGIATEAVVR